MEDIAAWERSLHGSLEGSSGGSTRISGVDEADLPPSEFDEEEIAERAAQAEEAELWAEFEKGTYELFPLGDILDTGVEVNENEDVDMI